MRQALSIGTALILTISPIIVAAQATTTSDYLQQYLQQPYPYALPAIYPFPAIANPTYADVLARTQAAFSNQPAALPALWPYPAVAQPTSSDVISRLAFLFQEPQSPLPAIYPYPAVAEPTYTDVATRLEAALIDPRLLILLAAIPPTASSTVPNPPNGTTTANGTDTAALARRITELEQQVNEVMAKRAHAGASATTQSPPITSCFLISRTLYRGMTGNDVSRLQTFLIDQGFLGAGNATGFFGSLTEAAVQAWQSARNIVSYGSPSATGWGVVGPKTRAFLTACQ